MPGRKKNENGTVPNRKENEQSKNYNKAIKGMRERAKKLRCQKTAANVHGTAMNRELNDGKYIEKSAKKARRKNRPSIAQNKKSTNLMLNVLVLKLLMLLLLLMQLMMELLLLLMMLWMQLLLLKTAAAWPAFKVMSCSCGSRVLLLPGLEKAGCGRG